MSTPTFATVQQLVTQITNDNTAQNNAVSAQIAEVSTLLADYAAAINNGQDGPTAADLQQVVAQLTSIDTSIQANTANVQASASAISSADPNAAPKTAAQQQPAPQPATGQTTTSS